MSQVMSKLKQFASNFKHKPSESASRRSSRVVGDSHQTSEDQCITNPTSTFTGLIIILSFFCLPTLLSNTNVSATASIISISMSGDPTVSIASSSDGKFADSGNSTITVTTNHASGYTLTAKATNSTNLVGTNGGSIPSIINAVSPTNYADNAYAVSHNLNDTWAYKPSVLYNASTQTTNSNTDYLPSPGTDTAQSPIDTLAVTNNANDGSYTVSIGARVSTATAIDNYSNSFVFAVVGNPTPYAITYNKNTTDTVSNMPANHTTSDTGAAGETVTLASNTPTRTGFSFTGWCTVTPTTSAGVDSCTGTGATTYAAGSTWTINQTSTTNSLNLYAMWTRASYNVKVNFAGSGVSSVSFTASGYTTRTVSSSGGTASLMYGVRYTTTMNFSSGNEFSSWALNSSSYGTLSSTSTNPTYFTPNTSSNSAIITATGKASWDGYMQNMPASECTTTARNVIDKRDNESYKVQRLADGKCWMLDNLRLGSTSTIALTAANTNSQGNFTLPASISTGFNSYTSPQINASYKNTTVYTYGTGSAKVGVYYNFCAASAGTICTSSNSSNASYDICPKGWKLPARNEFYWVGRSLPSSGMYQNNKMFNQNEEGYLWTSTRNNDTNMHSSWSYYDGMENDSGMDSDARNNGISIQCILK